MHTLTVRKQIMDGIPLDKHAGDGGEESDGTSHTDSTNGRLQSQEIPEWMSGRSAGGKDPRFFGLVPLSRNSAAPNACHATRERIRIRRANRWGSRSGAASGPPGAVHLRTFETSRLGPSRHREWMFRDV